MLLVGYSRGPLTDKRPIDRIADTTHSIEAAIEKGDWRTAQAATVRLRYWEGIEEAAKERLHSLG